MCLEQPQQSILDHEAEDVLEVGPRQDLLRVDGGHHSSFISDEDKLARVAGKNEGPLLSCYTGTFIRSMVSLKEALWTYLLTDGKDAVNKAFLDGESEAFGLLRELICL